MTEKFTYIFGWAAIRFYKEYSKLFVDIIILTIDLHLFMLLCGSVEKEDNF